MNAPEISVVVPLYNEGESLGELHRRLGAVLDGLGRSAEIIFVDDGSTDGSFALLAGLAEKDPRVRAVRFRANFGKSAALSCGFARARGAIIVTLDADLQDEPEEIPRLVARLGPDADLVSGWKFPRQDPWGKRAPSLLFNAVTRLCSGVPLHDFNCGFKAYKAEAAKAIDVYGELHRFLPVLAARRGFKVAEEKVRHSPRRFGRSKFGGKRFFRGLMDFFTVSFLTGYHKKPLHFFGFLALLFLLPGLVIDLYFTAGKLLGGETFSIWGRWPVFLLGNLLIIIAAQILTIGLLAEMLVASHHRPDDEYTVAEELGPSAPPP